MLSRRHRLRSDEVAEIMRRGKSLRGTYLSAKIIERGDTIRYAAVVPKAVAKKAVDRNRLRRALYKATAAISAKYLPKAQIVLLLRIIPPVLSQQLSPVILNACFLLSRSH